jgi:integrase
MQENNDRNLPHVKKFKVKIKSQILKRNRGRPTVLRATDNDHNFKIFIETLNSKHSVHLYTQAMDKFLKSASLYTCTPVSPSALISMDKELRQKLLEDYLLGMKNNVSASYLKTGMSAIRSFLEFHDVLYNKKRLNKLLPPKNKPVGGKPYTADQLDIMYKHAVGLKLKSMILVCASSGMRNEAVLSIKYGDLIEIDNTYGVIAYHNNREDPTAEYITFMTPEARTVLDTYTAQRIADGEKITNDTYVFPHKNSPSLPLNTINFTASMIRLGKFIEKNVDQSIRVTRYNIMAVHGMRKFFDHAMHRVRVVM